MSLRRPRQASGSVAGGEGGVRGGAWIIPRWHHTGARSWLRLSLCPAPQSELRAASRVTAHHQGAGTRRLCTWSSETHQKENCAPASPTQPLVNSRSQTQREGSGHGKSHTYLWEALSPPSPHPPLREEEGRGRRKERQEREAGDEEVRKSRKERERWINRDYFLKENSLRNRR